MELSDFKDANRAPLMQSNTRLLERNRTLNSSYTTAPKGHNRPGLIRSNTEKSLLGKISVDDGRRLFRERKLSRSESSVYERAFKHGPVGLITTSSSTDLVIENWLRASPVVLSSSSIAEYPPSTFERDNYQLMNRVERSMKRAKRKKERERKRLEAQNRSTDDISWSYDTITVDNSDDESSSDSDSDYSPTSSDSESYSSSSSSSSSSFSSSKNSSPNNSANEKENAVILDGEYKNPSALLHAVKWPSAIIGSYSSSLDKEKEQDELELDLNIKGTEEILKEKQGKEEQEDNDEKEEEKKKEEQREEKNESKEIQITNQYDQNGNTPIEEEKKRNVKDDNEDFLDYQSMDDVFVTTECSVMSPTMHHILVDRTIGENPRLRSDSSIEDENIVHLPLKRSSVSEISLDDSENDSEDDLDVINKEELPNVTGVEVEEKEIVEKEKVVKVEIEQIIQKEKEKEEDDEDENEEKEEEEEEEEEEDISTYEDQPLGLYSSDEYHSDSSQSEDLCKSSVGAIFTTCGGASSSSSGSSSSSNSSSEADVLDYSEYSDILSLTTLVVQSGSSSPQESSSSECSSSDSDSESEDSEGIDGKKNDVPRQGLPVDWNKKFQDILDRDDSTEAATLRKYSALRNLYHDFVATCKRYAKIIISEVNMDIKYKTVCPSTGIGGVAGGEKYIYHGILFKFALDNHNLYAGDQYAMKTAGHELRSLMHFFGIEGLRVPLMSLVDYRGYRIVGVSILPISSSSIVYGSNDAGRTIHKNNEFHALMKRAAERLKLKPHFVGNVIRKELYGPVDIEGHRGRSDGRFYVLDFARTFPPATPIKGLKGCFLYRLLRPELVMDNDVPLSSDAYSQFGKHNMGQHNREIDEATQRLLNTVIPQCANLLVTQYGTLGGAQQASSSSGHLVPSTNNVVRVIPGLSIKWNKNYRLLSSTVRGQVNRSPRARSDSSGTGVEPTDRSSSGGYRTISTELSQEAVKAATVLNAVGDICGDELTAVMHRSGINMRYMGALRSRVAAVDHPGAAGLSKCIFVEILARCAKNKLRELWRIKTQSSEKTELLGHVYKQIALKFLNGILVPPSSTPQELFEPSKPSQALWTDPNLLHNIKKHFGNDVFSTDAATDMMGIVNDGACLFKLIQRICQLARITLSQRAERAIQSRLLSNQHAQLLRFDIERLGARVKHMPIVSFAEAQLLTVQSRTLAKEEAWNAAERAMQEAVHHFECAIRTSPGDNTIIKAYAVALLQYSKSIRPFNPQALMYFGKAYEAAADLRPRKDSFALLQQVADAVRAATLYFQNHLNTDYFAKELIKFISFAGYIYEELYRETGRPHLHMRMGRLWFPRSDSPPTHLKTDVYPVPTAKEHWQDAGNHFRIALDIASKQISEREEGSSSDSRGEGGGGGGIEKGNEEKEGGEGIEISVVSSIDTEINHEEKEDNIEYSEEVVPELLSWLTKAKFPSALLAQVIALSDHSPDLTEIHTSKCSSPIDHNTLIAIGKARSNFRILDLSFIVSKLDPRVLMLLLNKSKDLEVVQLHSALLNSIAFAEALVKYGKDSLHTLKITGSIIPSSVLSKFSSLPLLRVLHLSSAIHIPMSGTTDYSTALTSIAQHCTLLEDVYFDTPVKLNFLVVLAERCPNITSLHLSPNTLLPETMLAEVFTKGLTQLRTLKLHHIGTISLKALTTHQKKLEYFTCKTIEHDGNCIVQLAEGCHGLKSIQVNDIHSKNFGDGNDSLIALAENCHDLERLTLYKAALKENVVHRFTQGCSKLTSLTLYECTFVDSNDLFIIISELHQLKELRLWFFGEWFTSKELEKGLVSAVSLELLNLMGCRGLVATELFNMLLHACPPKLKWLLLTNIWDYHEPEEIDNIPAYLQLLRNFPDLQVFLNPPYNIYGIQMIS